MLRLVPNALLAAAVLVTPLAAQRGVGLPILGPSTPPAAAPPAFHSPAEHHGRAHGRTVYLGTPYWADYFGASYAETPSVLLVQAPPAQKPADQEEPKPAAPLLIEWQGDRYVRRTDSDSANPRVAQPASVPEAKTSKTRSVDSTPPHVEPPPTLFIFRDGHREESSDYSIISGVIYARSQYWTSGSWSKQIPISQLDLPATFKANQERGVTFRLPGAPNEVVTRP
jgi:hypothetical protein